MNSFDFCVMIEDEERYDQIMAAVFGRQDLIQKTVMIRHLYQTTERLRQEVQFQMNFMEQYFDEMVNSGLYQLLTDHDEEPIRRSPTPPIRTDDESPILPEPDLGDSITNEIMQHAEPSIIVAETIARQLDLGSPITISDSLSAKTVPISPTSTLIDSRPSSPEFSTRTGLPRTDFSPPNRFIDNVNISQFTIPLIARERRYLNETLGGTRFNPIIVEESDSEEDDESSYHTASSDIYCYNCEGKGHLYVNCAHYACEHCGMFAPGHRVSDCWYR
jgi:hypothetical protein